MSYTHAACRIIKELLIDQGLALDPDDVANDGERWRCFYSRLPGSLTVEEYTVAVFDLPPFIDGQESY
jgi:hypothetical protein